MSETEKTIKQPAREVLQVSCAQMHWGRDIVNNVETTFQWIDRAKELGSDVVLFPEANLTGYDFPYVNELPRKLVVEAVEAVAARAAEKMIYAIVGSIQKRGRKDGYLNLAHVINRKGEVFYEYAKVQMAGADERRYCRPGNKIALFEIEGVLCSLAICRDGRHPELYRIPAMAGAKIFFQPSCSSESVEGAAWKRLSGRAQQAIGPTTFIYHCVANMIGESRDGKYTSSGMSFIKDPTGLSLAEAGHFQEEMITARLNLEKATARYARASMDNPKILNRFWEQAVASALEHANDPVR